MKQNRVPKNEYIIQPKGKTNPYKHDVIYSDLGQWKYPGQVTRIPSNQITMQGVPYPVQGIDDTGYSQMMYPGMDYTFPGQYVTEYPMAMYGGDPSLNNIEGHYPFGGQNTKTHTHMANGGWLDELPKAQDGLFNTLYAKLNPYNWGVPDYSGSNDVDDPGKWDWSTANYVARANKHKEFMHNNKRYAVKDKRQKENWEVAEEKNPDFFKNYAKNFLKSQHPEDYEKRYKDLLSTHYRYGNPWVTIEKPDIGPTGDYGRAYYEDDINQMHIYGVNQNPNITKIDTANLMDDYVEELLHSRQLKDLGEKGFDKHKQEDLKRHNVYYDRANNKWINYDEKMYNDPKSIEGVHYTQGYALKNRLLNRDYNLEEKPVDKKYRASALKYFQDKKFHPYENQDDLRTLQKALSEAGYDMSESLKKDGTYDGIYGEQTKYALDNWQKGKVHVPNIVKKSDKILTAAPTYNKKYGGLLDTMQVGGSKIKNKLSKNTLAKGERSNQDNTRVSNLPIKTLQALQQQADVEKAARQQYKEQPVISQGRKLTPTEQAYSDKVQARIANPSNDLGIIGANMASALTKLRYLNPEEIAATTNNPMNTIGLSAGIMKDALLLENPFWNPTLASSANKSISSMIKGVTNTGPDIYKSIENPSPTNSANILSDIVSMSHIGAISNKVPQFVKTMSTFKNKKIPIPLLKNNKITVGNIKKGYGVVKGESNEPIAVKKMGGWLDDLNDKYKRGGQKSLKKYTSKNIATSVNDIMLRNETLFGPAGKKRYKPGLKYQSGGNYSIVDYLASKGEDFSKENRQQLAQKYGVKNYDFSSEKNLELLDKLQNSKPIVQKPVDKAPAPSYFIKPIEKENSRATDRTGKTKKVKVPTKEEIAYSQLPKEVKLQMAAQKHAENNQDQLRKYTPQGGISKTWETISNPMTALRELNTYGYIPDNISQHPDKNPLDMVINPAYPVNAAGRIIKAGFTPQTYSDAAKTALYLGAQLAGDNTASGYDEAAMNTLGLAGDIGAVFGAGQFVKNARRGIRNSKFANELTIGKGVNKTTFNDSKEFFDHFNKEAKATGQTRALKKKELDFLNKEIKQRGILEVDRRHPLDPRQPISKALIIPEDYQWKTVLNPKNIAKNLYKTIKEGSPESLYTMGQGRVAGWNEYLGMPTKNNPYRIHPESFTKGQGMLYTVPDKEIAKLQKSNEFMPNASSMVEAQQMPSQGIKDLSFYKESLSNTSKEFNQKAYEKIYDDMINVMNPKTGDFLYANEKEIKKILGPKSKFKYNLEKHRTLVPEGDIPDWINQEGNVYKTGDWDKYIGSHGGVGWNVEKVPGSKYEKWSMEDVWDINPLSRFKKLPSMIRNINAGKILGGKDFKVQLDYFAKPGGKDIIPMIPKAYGGQQKNSIPGWLDNLH